MRVKPTHWGRIHKVESLSTQNTSVHHYLRFQSVHALDVPMMKQGWHGVFEWCFLFQVLTFDSLGSCTSTESNTSPLTKTYPSAISTALLHINSLNQPQPTRIIQGGPASPETPSLNLRTVGLAVVLPPKSPGTAKDRTASHQHLRVAIRFR